MASPLCACTCPRHATSLPRDRIAARLTRCPPQDLRPLEARQALARNLNEARRRLGGEFPLLDPIADMHIDSPDFAKQMKRIKSLEKRLARNPLQDAADRQEQLAAYERRQTLLDQAAALRKRVKGSQVRVRAAPRRPTHAHARRRACPCATR